MRMTTSLRELLAGPGIVMGGGAHDGLSARIVEQVGYPLCVVTGAGASMCRGYPDIGLVTMTVAPLTAAPLGSVTEPSIEPVVLVWAIALIANNASAMAMTNINIFFIISVLS